MPSFARVNERLVHFNMSLRAGKRAVVLANSLGTDLRIWDQVLAHLPPDVPTLTYDMAGHGLSDIGARTTADFADDLAALMDFCRVKDALICGVSFGGMIAQSLAARRPDLVAGLVLCNTGTRIGSSESWAERIASIDDAGLEPIADAILQRWFSPLFLQRSADLVSGYRLMLTRTPIDGYQAVCCAIRDTDLSDTTAHLTCPTLCVAGADDRATEPKIVYDLASLLEDSSVTCYEDVGHLPCIEAPQRLAEDIKSHTERLS